ncbi:hypothetical protein ACWEQL_26120 [Kitasatospora sp. NPDC004240]
MKSLDNWRTATSFVPRRTALRILGVSVIGAVVSACSGNGEGSSGVAGVALGKFAAGTWKVSSPTANFKSGILTVTESGSWTCQLDDNDGSPEKHTSSGTWRLAGQSLQLTANDKDASASSVPPTVAGDASAHFTWLYGTKPDDMQVSYNSRSREITIVRQTGYRPQTITAVRA